MHNYLRFQLVYCPFNSRFDAWLHKIGRTITHKLGFITWIPVNELLSDLLKPHEIVHKLCLTGRWKLSLSSSRECLKTTASCVYSEDDSCVFAFWRSFFVSASELIDCIVCVLSQSTGEMTELQFEGFSIYSLANTDDFT